MRWSWLGAVAALSVAGCAGGGGSEGGGAVPAGEDADGALGALPDLPPYGGCWIGSCDGGAERGPERLEHWAGRSEAIVVGDVVEVEPLFEPAAVGSGGMDVLSAAGCLERGGRVVGGLRLVLDRVDVLYGQAPGRIELRFGAGVVDTEWCTQPSPGHSLRWGEGRGLAVGQRLGISLAHDPGWDEWTNVSPLEFLVSEEGVVRFREDLSDCGPELPVGIDGAPLEELRQRLRAIDPADPDIADGRELRERLFAPEDAEARRASRYLALCSILVEPTGCVTDNDCDVSTICHPDGSCAPP